MIKTVKYSKKIVDVQEYFYKSTNSQPTLMFLGLFESLSVC
jgi:hypothetical protein